MRLAASVNKYRSLTAQSAAMLDTLCATVSVRRGHDEDDGYDGYDGGGGGGGGVYGDEYGSGNQSRSGSYGRGNDGRGNGNGNTASPRSTGTASPRSSPSRSASKKKTSPPNASRQRGQSRGRGGGGGGGGGGRNAAAHRGVTRGAGDTSSNATVEEYESLSAKLPVGGSEEDRQKRRALFNSFDPNGNGYLSLAEVDLGVRKALDSDALFDAKPAIMRAFQVRQTSSGCGCGRGWRVGGFFFCGVLFVSPPPLSPLTTHHFLPILLLFLFLSLFPLPPSTTSSSSSSLKGGQGLCQHRVKAWGGLCGTIRVPPSPCVPETVRGTPHPEAPPSLYCMCGCRCWVLGLECCVTCDVYTLEEKTSSLFISYSLTH